MLRNPLHQVFVETRSGELVALGPKMVKEACENFASSIRQQIALGNEKHVSNPHIVAVL
jgi:hypothetical protein